MANERVFMARNTAPKGEIPKWEKYFPKTVVDAILASDREGENKTVMDLVNERIQAVVGRRLQPTSKVTRMWQMPCRRQWEIRQTKMRLFIKTRRRALWRWEVSRRDMCLQHRASMQRSFWTRCSTPMLRRRYLPVRNRQMAARLKSAHPSL